MLTLFMSITGGVDWEFAMEPLMGSLGKTEILDELLVLDACLVARQQLLAPRRPDPLAAVRFGRF